MTITCYLWKLNSMFIHKFRQIGPKIFFFLDNKNFKSIIKLKYILKRNILKKTLSMQSYSGTVNNNVVVDKLAEEILNSFPKIYYPFRRLLGKYSEFQITTLQILNSHQGNWFLRKRLYKELELSPEVVSGRIMPPLIKDKLIESTRKVPPCPDRRTSMDRITPDREKFLEKAISSRKQFIKEVLELMSEEHRETITSLLRKVDQEITKKVSDILRRVLVKME